jgi:O-antigen biosynthesis protein WbqP
MYKRFFKRVIDFVAALAALIVCAPLGAAIALWVRLDSPGPAIFRQKRVGIGKTHFMILKFRTMRADTPGDVPTHLLSDPYAHITRSGRFLRKLSLDELPQLINVLRGDMSIVGPRPALWNQYDLIAQRDKWGANDVRPGVTGWAQVNGRDTLPIDVKARLDGEYVRRMGFLMDARCVLRTVIAALGAEGVAEGGRRAN